MNTENEPVEKMIQHDKQGNSERSEILIYVVDDQPAFAHGISDMIQYDLKLDRKHKVVVFTNPLEALNYINVNLPDLVFTNRHMSEMRGFELAQHLRGNPETEHIKIVMRGVAGRRDYPWELVDGYFMVPITHELLVLVADILTYEPPLGRIVLPSYMRKLVGNLREQ